MMYNVIFIELWYFNKKFNLFFKVKVDWVGVYLFFKVCIDIVFIYLLYIVFLVLFMD